MVTVLHRETPTVEQAISRTTYPEGELNIKDSNGTFRSPERETLDVEIEEKNFSSAEIFKRTTHNDGSVTFNNQSSGMVYRNMTEFIEDKMIEKILETQEYEETNEPDYQKYVHDLAARDVLDWIEELEQAKVGIAVIKTKVTCSNKAPTTINHIRIGEETSKQYYLEEQLLSLIAMAERGGIYNNSTYFHATEVSYLDDDSNGKPRSKLIARTGMQGLMSRNGMYAFANKEDEKSGGYLDTTIKHELVHLVVDGTRITLAQAEGLAVGVENSFDFDKLKKQLNRKYGVNELAKERVVEAFKLDSKHLS